MKALKYTFVFFMTFSLCFYSCEEEDSIADDPIATDDPCDINDINNLVNRINDRALAFSTNQTRSNCIAYKDVMEEFVARFRPCPAVQSQLDTIENTLTQIDCDNL